MWATRSRRVQAEYKEARCRCRNRQRRRWPRQRGPAGLGAQTRGGEAAPNGKVGAQGANGINGLNGTSGTQGSAGSAGTAQEDDIYSTGSPPPQNNLKLIITTAPPASVDVNGDFGFVVTVENSQGAVDTAFDGAITAIMSTNLDDATLSGPFTVNAVNGVATFAGLSINTTGNGYAIEGESGGTTSLPDSIDVIGVPPPPPPPPTPASPTPFLVTRVSAVNSKKGMTSFVIDYNQALDSSSAKSSNVFHVYEGVKRKRRKVFKTALKIKSVVYTNDSVTVKLKKPYKGLVEVAVTGAFESLDGSFTTVDYTTTAK